MAIFQYKTEQFLPISINEAWVFFSSAKNLAKITPPELDFKILTQVDEKKEIYEGMLMEYTVKPLLGIPLRWETKITKLEKPKYFTDKQLKGPYKIWEHTHTFIEKENGILMKDIVNYELPFGFLGNIAHKLIVRKKVEQIFTYREEILKKIFKDGNASY